MFLVHIIIIALLTIITQIGGLVYVLVLVLTCKTKNKRRLKRLGLFLGLYVITTFIVVPPLAKLSGRMPIETGKTIKLHSVFYSLLNRNYVRPELNTALQNIANDFYRKTAQPLVVYDANFPFFDGFPLLPHLSHKDGKKVDVALVYQTKDGVLSPKKKSISGYGVYVEPKPNEIDQPQRCLDNGHWQYDYPKYLTLGRVNKKLEFSKNGTKQLIKSIVNNKNIGKVLIEPHLKQRMGLSHSKIRYHGCQAVRHDDHIHLQLH